MATPKPYVPTIDEVLEAGYSPAQAEKIVAGLQTQADGPELDSPFVGYRVTGVMPRGFWAAKRKFAAGKTQDIRIEDLEAAETLELDNANPKHLIVQKIGLD